MNKFRVHALNLDNEKIFKDYEAEAPDVALIQFTKEHKGYRILKIKKVKEK